ncbi:hypothetical protein P9272_18595 [Mesorhizobium sp. WSM4976]|uniref:hypothetical protein n=1 Tax=Mesorhizobium sp. WSM4976 TaxID=3038549 RepID=UPI002417DD35|nr:hypothetical protein [Mesorhizobium sp. WSM4976]MDG4895583.1 hypothetical protein [Mesorhizobium sp. WSM4976]
MKRASKAVLVVMLALTVVAIAFAVWGVISGDPRTSRFFQTASTFAAIVAAVQLDVAGVFGRLFDEYSDATKYPFGPPSHITREIIDHPDWMLFGGFREILFYDTRFAFWIAVLSFVLSLIGIWV